MVDLHVIVHLEIVKNTVMTLEQLLARILMLTTQDTAPTATDIAPILNEISNLPQFDSDREQTVPDDVLANQLMTMGDNFQRHKQCVFAEQLYNLAVNKVAPTSINLEAMPL